METPPFDREQALAHHTELMRLVSVGAYTERGTEHYETGTYPDDGVEEEIDRLEFAAALEGLQFIWHEDEHGSQGHWSLEAMSEWEQAQFRAYHVSEQATEHTEAILWHVNVELPGTKLEKKQYHITIADGTDKLDVIINYGPQKLLSIEPYLHHEMDYTVHDACDHINDYCVLEDPETSEYKDATMEDQYYWRVTQRLMGAAPVSEQAKD